MFSKVCTWIIWEYNTRTRGKASRKMIFVTEDILTHFSWGMKVCQIKKQLIGISPLNTCVFSLFITIPNNFHEIHLNNLYTIEKIAHLSYTHHNCVKVQGVYWNGSQGIPREVLQTEVHDNKPVYWVQRVGLFSLCCTYVSSLNQFFSLSFFCVR